MYRAGDARSPRAGFRDADSGASARLLSVPPRGSAFDGFTFLVRPPASLLLVPARGSLASIHETVVPLDSVLVATAVLVLAAPLPVALVPPVALLVALLAPVPCRAVLEVLPGLPPAVSATLRSLELLSSVNPVLGLRHVLSPAVSSLSSLGVPPGLVTPRMLVQVVLAALAPLPSPRRPRLVVPLALPRGVGFLVLPLVPVVVAVHGSERV